MRPARQPQRRLRVGPSTGLTRTAVAAQAALPRPSRQVWFSDTAAVTKIAAMRHAAPVILSILLAACVPVLPDAPETGKPETGRPVTDAPARVPDTAPARATPIVITDNSGGNVMAMVQRRETLARSGRPVEIRGYCRSACTILTTLPNACLGGNARIGFHAPRLPGTQVIPPYVDEIMGSYYRAGIRDHWFGGWNRSMTMQIITAEEYVRLDPRARICGRG